MVRGKRARRGGVSGETPIFWLSTAEPISVLPPECPGACGWEQTDFYLNRNDYKPKSHLYSSSPWPARRLDAAPHPFILCFLPRIIRKVRCNDKVRIRRETNPSHHLKANTTSHRQKKKSQAGNGMWDYFPMGLFLSPVGLFLSPPRASPSIIRPCPGQAQKP